MSEPAARSDAAPLRVLSTLATQVAWPKLMQRFEAISGRHVEAVFGPTNALIERLRAGETADVAILTRAAVDELAAAGTLTGSADIARSYVGLAVRAGAPRPDITTPAALIATLLAARSIAYSRIGASGIYFADLIRRLGIAEAVNAKAIVTPIGFTASRIVSGEAELAVQQVSELKAVAGVDIVGLIPREFQQPSLFTAAVLVQSTRAEAARNLVAFLASGEAAASLEESGLEALGGVA